MYAERGIGAQAFDPVAGHAAGRCPVLASLTAPLPLARPHDAPSGYRLGDLLWPDQAARRLIDAHLVVLNRHGVQRL